MGPTSAQVSIWAPAASGAKRAVWDPARTLVPDLGPGTGDATKCKNSKTNEGKKEEGVKTPKDGCDSKNDSDVDLRQRGDPDPE